MTGGAGAGYRTLRAGAEVSGEFEDRRSRFIAQLTHVGSEAEADAFLAAVRARHHDARHNVPAWILADGRERCSDDGEPSRTSGMPVLEVLRGAGLADVCCVVTRYFGGTLLGPGGLVRAYTAAAQAAVAAAEKDGAVCEMTLVCPVTVQLPYALYDRVTRLAADAGGRVSDSLFAEDVQLTCVFRAGDEERFCSAVRELAAGEDLARPGEPRFAEF
ncbi:IMPACT family protein [Thermophilibacter sp.]|uniref:IMPACT family protein n=1 Tax=Thermophilibacter sp. TaxID=2847309 RepID=UPI003A9287B3